MVDLEIVSKLAGKPVVELSQVKGGANNESLKVFFEDGDLALLKHYTDSEQGRLRLLKEFNAFSFLQNNGVGCVPDVIATDSKSMALYGWVDGEKVTDVNQSHIQQVIGFVKVLDELSQSGIGRDNLSDATDAVFSAQSIINQLNKRLQRIKTVTNENFELTLFLEKEFEPCFGDMTASLKRDMGVSGFSHEIDQDQRILSPSDFGFHNALQQSDGKLIFVDFEYFGWDCPAALISDFLWHPAMSLDESLKHYFIDEVTVALAADTMLRHRLTWLFPFIGLTWALIVLNEFIPEVWTRRVASGSVKEEQRNAVYQQQLNKSEYFLKSARQSQEVFPYEI